MIREHAKPILQIGVIGSGRMAPRFIDESRYVSGAYVGAVYNPIVESARAFQEKYQIEVQTEDFDRFVDSVDAVYIASPNETHYEYAKRVLQAGKHVLSEKPLAFTREKTMELYDLAHEKHAILMEGIRTAYAPSFQQLINIAKSGKIGEIRDVEATFTRIADERSRERTDAEFGGAFLEFAGYTMLPIFKIFGLDYEDVTIDSIRDENGLDVYTKMQFRYKDGMATAKMGVGVKSEGNLVISGTKGYVLAPSPWWLTKKFDIRYEDASQVDHYDMNFMGDGLRYELAEFVSKINKSEKKDFKLTAEESIRMSDVVEKFMRQERGMK
jgi:predicted dehydrogenase